MKILIVEDNKNLRENLCFLLKKYSFLPESAENWEVALQKINSSNYDLIVLDINMPVMNWKIFLQKLREKNNSVPVIALTSDWLLESKLEMFDLWIDDYLTKPFETQELVARIKSILKRKDKKIENTKKIWNIEINFNTKKIYYDWNVQEFSYKQYLIIEFLCNNFWTPKNKLQIMEYVWWENEENLEFNSTTLESHIYSIRKKLWKDFIKTIKSIWYIIE